MADRGAQGPPPKVRMRTKAVLATAEERKQYEQTKVAAATDVAAVVEGDSVAISEVAAQPAKPKPVSQRVGSIFAVKPTAPPPAKPAAQVQATVEAVLKPSKPAKATEKPKPVIDVKGLPDISEFPKKLRRLSEGLIEETYADPYYLKADAPKGSPEHLSDTFVPTNRRGFAEFIQTQFRHFELPKLKKPDPEACAKQGAKGAEQMQIYLYQQFIREYIRSETPYRGILVYHGLGSGKTCSAIAASEALFARARKRIIIMTPKSLRKNFTKELMVCGFQHYRLQNHWVELEPDDTTRLFAMTVLNLPETYVKKATAFYVPNFEKKDAPNYASFEPSKQKLIYNQIQAMIDNQFTFIHYNGVTAQKLKEWACADIKDRIFDNAVIVIDEVHNLIRLMQETIEPYLQSVANLRRKIRPEPVQPGRWQPGLCGQTQNYKRGFLFYRLLLDATNSKIIGLSGTPLINYPEEIAILMNILHGYIPVANFRAKIASEKAIQAMKDAAAKHPYIDFYEVKKSGEGAIITLTPLPERTMKKIEGGEMKGVVRVKDGVEVPDFRTIVEDYKKSLAGTVQFTADLTITAEPLLPPFGKQFNETFIDTLRGTIQKDRELVLAKRMTGLISYYRGSKEELMPKVLCDEVVKCPMSEYQQNEYMKVRVKEAAQEEREKKTRQTQGMGAKQASIWNDIYDIKLKKQQSSYRMASRQLCNFAFPEEVTRPRTDDEAEEILEVGDEPVDIIDAELEQGADAKDKEKEKEDEERARKEDEAIEKQEQKAFGEEGVAATEAPVKQPVKDPNAVKAVPGEPEEGEEDAERKRLRADCRVGRKPGEKYQDAIDRAKLCLRTFCEDKLKMSTSPDDDALAKYSPKYQAMLERILSSPGSNLVYSQFLQMEGIGIFALAMLANNFRPIRIERDGDGFKFSKSTLKSLAKKDQNRFLMFTGEEEEDIRKLALDVFNMKVTELPEGLAKPLRANGFTDNKKGQLCRVFCITSAGAEGLSLKNVRRVHIMETYWNDVRLTQVKGRAIRICSHVDFENVADRSVEIFTYVSVYDARALRGEEGWKIDEKVEDADRLVLNDESEYKDLGIEIPKGAKDYVLTSDERLMITSARKQNITRNLENVMKAVAVDCRLNLSENGVQTMPPKKCGEPTGESQMPALPCLFLEGKVGDFLYHPLLENDLVFSKEFKKAEPEAVKAFKFTKGGVEYIAVAKINAVTQLITSFDIHDISDTSLSKPIGTMGATPEGKPDKITFKLFTAEDMKAAKGTKKDEPEGEGDEEEEEESSKPSPVDFTRIELPRTLEDIDALVVRMFPEVSERSKERIKQDTYGGNPMLVDDFESVDTSANKNDCLIHSFLIVVSPSFRKLKQDEKDTFADQFRRVLLPRFYAEQPTSSSSEVKLLARPGFLDDRHQASLTKFFPVNIVNFYTSDGKISPDAPDATYKDKQPFVFIYNPDRAHYRAVRKLEGDVATYSFNEEDAREIINTYTFTAEVKTRCDVGIKVGDTVIYKGERKVVFEVLYEKQDKRDPNTNLCTAVRFVKNGPKIPVETLKKPGEEESEEEESSSAETPTPESSTAESPTAETEDESEEDSEDESETGVLLSSDSESEEEEEPEYLEYKYEGTTYNVVEVKDASKKVVSYDVYKQDNHKKKIGTFKAKLSKDRTQFLPDKTTFQAV